MPSTPYTHTPPLSGPRFTLPPGREATRPPEARGLARDEVRLLVARPDRLVDARFRDLGAHLRPGDLVVVNTSATLPAAVDATWRDGTDLVVHVAGPSPEGGLVVELRRTDGLGPHLDAQVGEVVQLASGTRLTLRAPHVGGPDGGTRLWQAQRDRVGPWEEELRRHGRPIRYGYLDGAWPLASYQTVFGRTPGSAEMASAGRPFRDATVTDLVTRGVLVAPVTLHTGVSSQEAHEPPPAERFEVPPVTAAAVDHVRRTGGRIVAVGTTVTRALESAAAPGGQVRATGGWTDLVLGPDRPARVVTGLVTGWHAPEASHLQLLEAVAGAPLVQAAYDAAVGRGYRWHEFGDSCLLLP
ncbi:S-adenosylmethionine:tRNA ribosyltransferase-isomerase [Nitriliruptoraceae bacterium ZYF776]|nr:S-adenosylmethionine:tRNA ribosyltransferase-isomerase [Profundirhabdus halotolerans]